MKESKVEKTLREKVEALGGQCIKQEAWMGIPDRLILLPGGCVGLCETKRPVGGKLSPIQLIWLKRFHAMGHIVGVVSRIDEIPDYLDRVICKRWTEDDIEDYVL